MDIFFDINIDKNIVQIHNDKNIKLLGKNLIDISLEAYQYIC